MKSQAQLSIPDDIYYESGSVRAKFFNKGSHGIQYMGFYENGKLKILGYFKDGHNHGEWISWDTDGRKIATAHYEKGIKEGCWLLWDRLQNSKTELHYNNGKLIAASSENRPSSLQNTHSEIPLTQMVDSGQSN